MASRSVMVAMLAFALSTVTAAATSPAERTGAARPSSPARLAKVTYTAHRGGALEVPENSMSGLVATFERGQADVLDLDSRVLKDGTLAVIHDATLDRTTYATGAVRDLTLAQWRKVLLRPDPSLPGSWHPEPPPTVEGVLDRFGGHTQLIVELKDPAGLPALARMIKEQGLTRSVYINTNEPSLARKAHDLGLLTQLWRSHTQMRGDDPADWRAYVDVLDVDYRAPDAEVRRAVTSGIRGVWAHTVNTVKERDRMLRLGCTGVITDAPGLMVRTPVHG
ncbi:glycerophosphodiester phosphodiesterase [Streptomyces sp. XD-27]|uniref:glycerophosphodiester phosphodiesterase n=1 Tax=Streptomyces sp. XD-27 TaxID=3062779 RepID=UPI0026F422C7|nr:glycerophosphodiester phosphodiesterase [Streptomyces sp. XD-27]WKX70012.1 glycerophosphodiester phosphodiesterase [Streptomyces sp. XD-27]